MTITGATRIYPLIGFPIAQVKTPPLINAHFAATATDAIMVPLELRPEGIENFFRTLRLWSNCGGVSVTIPHKQAAFASVDALTLTARLSRAVNVIRRERDGTLIGDMTDGMAFVTALEANGFDPNGKTATVIGAGGGAGAAICEALCKAKIARLALIETEPARAEMIAATLVSAFPGIEISLEAGDPRQVELLVNASPLGMTPSDPLPFDPQTLPASALVADIVTSVEMTPLLVAARRRGLAIQTGIEMARAQIVHQSAAWSLKSGHN